MLILHRIRRILAVEMGPQRRVHGRDAARIWQNRVFSLNIRLDQRKSILVYAHWDPRGGCNSRQKLFTANKAADWRTAAPEALFLLSNEILCRAQTSNLRSRLGVKNRLRRVLCASLQPYWR